MSLSGPDWVKLNQLLDEALDLDPARRSQWIDSLPAQDSVLSDTLRDLLLRKNAPETSEVLREAPSLGAVQFAAVAAGDVVGPYRLIRELGAGGTATVWLAERADGSLRRQIALKLPRIAWMDGNLAERLNRERDILASLEHPSIARLYDAGLDGAGRPFLALEYVEGIPLDRYSIDRQLSIAQRLALFVRVARAVAVAHAHLIVHRDLKPTNILVKDSGEICLLDFGIARLLQPESLHDLQLTRAGARALTPQYAAPEQFTSQPITVATDVYTLGVLLYWLLGERSPYDLQRDSLAEIEEAIVGRDPVPLTKGMERKLARTVRGDLEMIVRKAMSKQPADRYETVNAFIEDIERYQKNLPVRAQPERFAYRLKKFVTRNRASVAAASVAVVAVLTGLSVALWQAHLAQVEAQRAERIKSFIASIFTQAVPKQGAGGVVTASDLLGAANKRVESELGDNRRDKGELQAMIGASFLALAEPAHAAPVLRQALDNCDAGADYQNCRVHAAVLLAESLLGTRDEEAGLLLLDQHLPRVPSSPAAAQDVVEGWRVRGEIFTILNRQEEALAAYSHAEGIAEQSLGKDHEATLRVLIAKADSYAYFAYTPEYVAAGEEVARRATKTRGHLRPDTLLTQSERVYALALVSAGRGAEALPITRRVVEDTRRLDAADTPRVADAEWGLAVALANQGILDEAIPLMRHVIDHEVRLGSSSSSMALLERTAWLGMMYATAAMPAEAHEAAQRIDQLATQAGSVSEPLLLRNELTKAYSAMHSGDWKLAEQLTQAIASRTELMTARTEALAIGTLNARLQNKPARAHESAVRLVEQLGSARLPANRRGAYFSIAADAFLASNDIAAAQQALASASEEYAKAAFRPSIQMSSFINAKAQLALRSGDLAVRADQQALTDSWQKVNPNSVWHGEALYWLSRVQEAGGQPEVAAQTRQRARAMLKDSTLPAMRLLAAQ